MCRKATVAIALVVLTAFGAHAAPGSEPGSQLGPAPAKLHRNAKAPATRPAPPAYSRHHAAPAHTRLQTQVSTARKPTPHEAGRTAGLAIRRELAQKQAARRNVALHVNPSRATFRPESERVLRSNKETPAVPAMEVASASPVFLLRPAPADDPAQEEPAQAVNSPTTGENAGAGTRRIARPTHANPNVEVPDAETPDANAEQASVRIPLRSNPAPLRGSHESLERQNARLDAEGLERIEDESDLVDRITHKLLVPIPVSSALTVNSELAATHRYCRPWTALFLTDLSRAHDAAFRRPLEVSSAVRTMEYQKRLMEINGNAAPAEGDIVSPHLTGATVDIAKDGLSRDEIAWMRRRLLALETAGKIDVEEEFRQACFHITVYKSYAPPRAPHPATQAGDGSTGSRRHKAVDPAGPTAAQGL